jgi:hypothetical protein
MAEPNETEPSLQFGPMIEPTNEVRVSTEEYVPAEVHGDRRFKISGAGARAIIREDMAHKGMALVGEDPTSHEMIFAPDATLAAEAAKRQAYEAYRRAWGDGAARRKWNGVPLAPKEWEAIVATGADPFPQPFVPEPPTPEQVLERRIAALEAMIPRLPA